MARAALNWSMPELAQRAGVGVNTVNRFEAGQDARMSSVEKMQAALSEAGVIFIAENGEGAGVRLPKGFMPATVPTASHASLKVRASTVRAGAARAADRAMSDMDASPEEKTERRERLTNEPDVVRKARSKSRDAS
ncbi:putative transcription factor, MBF1 like protein precursor [Bosea sp. LC85]|uniref:helix-turn-helix domain-containing protein n=1 Tax=Bosea sp. LC85 TaxID=1502851 RepID=UPI0004E32932|nr:putative transcription factor, MBF1 like protein precursor [Bosea sp. LC85]